MQAQRHAPGLKVTVYDGLAKKVADKDADDSAGAKKKKRRSFKKMSTEERFKTSAVRKSSRSCHHFHDSAQLGSTLSP